MLFFPTSGASAVAKDLPKKGSKPDEVCPAPTLKP